MTALYLEHRISCQPRRWHDVAQSLVATGDDQLQAEGGCIYGIWRSQIGRPRDELTAITVWRDPIRDVAALASGWIRSQAGVVDHSARGMTPTLRPTSTDPPTRQGNYAFRHFETPRENWDEFLRLCGEAWPNFEASYDSQVIGLWELKPIKPQLRESLLLTRRPSLAMWERSKLPEGDVEAEVRRKLSRRYDLCDATDVFTTTLITARDAADTARWT